MDLLDGGPSATFNDQDRKHAVISDESAALSAHDENRCVYRT